MSITPSRHWIIPIALVALLAAGAIWAGEWIVARFTHSISKDAFIESHLVNVAPQVHGEVVAVYVQEQERVKKGQLLALVEPSIYRREVELAKAKVEVAQATLAKTEADLELLAQQVPQQVAAAEAKLAAMRDNQEKADDAVEMVTRDIDEAIVAAERSVDAAEAALVMAQEDFTRFGALYADGSGTQRRLQEATKTRDMAKADKGVAEAKLGQAQANRKQIDIAHQEAAAAKSAVTESVANLELAKIGNSKIVVLERLVAERKQAVTEAKRALQLAETNLGYTRVTAPFDGIIAKKWRHLGDYAHIGDPIFNIYNPDFLYVTVHLEETRLEGVNPGNSATLHLEAYEKPFRGRVVWVGSATGANFSLIPRDLSSGEFTYVIQRVPTRIAIERDDRWDLLKPGLSVTVEIEHGPGDAQWAAEAWRIEREQADTDQVPLP